MRCHALSEYPNPIGKPADLSCQNHECSPQCELTIIITILMIVIIAIITTSIDLMLILISYLVLL